MVYNFDGYGVGCYNFTILLSEIRLISLGRAMHKNAY